MLYQLLCCVERLTFFGGGGKWGHTRGSGGMVLRKQRCSAATLLQLCCSSLEALLQRKQRFDAVGRLKYYC